MKHKTKTETSVPVPMDPSITENLTGVQSANNQRSCYAIKTLTEEVWDLFPETPVTYSAYNGRNTALAVSFDLTALDAGTDRGDFLDLLRLISVDERVESVQDGPDSVLVTIRANARTQDNREPFGLANALDVLDEGEGLMVYAEESDEGFSLGGSQ